MGGMITQHTCFIGIFGIPIELLQEGSLRTEKTQQHREHMNTPYNIKDGHRRHLEAEEGDCTSVCLYI